MIADNFLFKNLKIMTKMDFLKKLSCWALVALSFVSFQQAANAQCQATCIGDGTAGTVDFNGQLNDNCTFTICAHDIDPGIGYVDPITGAILNPVGQYASANSCTNLTNLVIRRTTQSSASDRGCISFSQNDLNADGTAKDWDIVMTAIAGADRTYCSMTLRITPPNPTPAATITCSTFEPIDCTVQPTTVPGWSTAPIATDQAATCWFEYRVIMSASGMDPLDDNSTGSHCFRMWQTWQIQYRPRRPAGGAWTNLPGGSCTETIDITDTTGPEIHVSNTNHNDQAPETYAVVQNHPACFVGEPDMMYSNVYDLNWSDACGRRVRTYDECDFDVLLMFVRELDYNESITTNGTSCVRTYTQTFINDPRQDNYYCYQRIFEYVAVDNCGNESEDHLYIVQNVTDDVAPVLTTSDDLNETITINSCDIFAQATITATINAPTDNCAASKYLAIFVTVYDEEGNVVMTVPSQYAQGALTISVSVPGSDECEVYTIKATAKDPCLNTSNEIVFTREVCNPDEGPIAKCDDVRVTMTPNLDGDLVGVIDAVDMDEGSEDYCTVYDQVGIIDPTYNDFTFYWSTPEYCVVQFGDFDDFDGCLGVSDDYDPEGPHPANGLTAWDAFAEVGITPGTVLYQNYNFIIVQISRSPNGPWTNTVVFTEADCPGPVTMYLRAINLLGEETICSSTITFQNCPGARNSGRIANENNVGLKNVTVNFDNGTSTLTDADGKYEYVGNVTSVTPYNNSNPRNGLSGADLYDIRRHILDIAPLNSGYKMLAADANNDARVSGADLTSLANLLVGNTSSLPNNTSWRYVAGDYAMTSTNWTSAPATRGAGANVNFYGVKVGDVNMSANLNQRFSGVLQFGLEDKAVKAGDIVEVPFRASDFNNMTAYQMTLEFAGLAYKGIKGADVVVNATEANKLAMVWFGDKATSVANDDAVFTLVFEATEATRLSKALAVSGAITAPEASKADGSLLNVALRFKGADAGFALLQNVPNPFQGTTSVQFTLPEASKATLTVFDVAGRALKTINGSYAKGFNQVEINSNDLPAGVLYYQLNAGNFSATKKMIVLD